MAKNTIHTLVLLGFWLFSFLFVQAQTKIEIGFNVSTELTDIVYFRSAQKTSEPRLGFALEGFFRQDIKNRFSIQVGLGTRTMRLHQDWPNAVFGSDIDENGGIISRSHVVQNLTWQEMHIVMGFKYWFLSAEKGPYVGLGANPTYFFYQRYDYDIAYGNGETEQLNGQRSYFHRFSIAFNACIGFQFPVSDKLNMSIESFGNQFMNRELGSYAFPFNSGLRLGISF